MELAFGDCYYSPSLQSKYHERKLLFHSAIHTGIRRKAFLTCEKIVFVKSNILYNIETALKIAGIAQAFDGLGKVAVKLHMGEYGNLHYIRPTIVRQFVDILKNLGNTPFLFDTPTLYSGSRDTPSKYIDTARRNGFCSEVIGCPIIISDGASEIATKGALGSIKVAKALCKADGILILSHGKGHPDLGFGGAIKNIAMGCVAKKTKKDLHTMSQPVLAAECSGCGKCVDACTKEGISLKDGKAIFNYDNCFGCGICIQTCPVQALKPRSASIDTLFSETFFAIIETLRPKPIFFVNVLMDITPRCDCFPSAGKDEGFPICSDIGLLIGTDAISIDSASIDLITKNCGDILEKIHHVNPMRLINTLKKYANSKGVKLIPYELLAL